MNNDKENIVKKINKVRNEFHQTAAMLPNVLLLGRKQYKEFQAAIDHSDGLVLSQGSPHLMYWGMHVFDIAMDDYISVGYVITPSAKADGFYGLITDVM